jgi:hypothetical protein
MQSCNFQFSRKCQGLAIHARNIRGLREGQRQEARAQRAQATSLLLSAVSLPLAQLTSCGYITWACWCHMGLSKEMRWYWKGR